MRGICLVLCVLIACAMAGCRPTVAPVPNTPLPSTHSVSPLPTPIAPQAVPEVTRQATPSPVSTATAMSGIHLTATIGPTCPGPERPGQVCTQPYQGLFVVTDDAGGEAARPSTDQNGQATIDLPPGDYIITPGVEGLWPSGAPTAVTVPAGQYVAVDIELDSGMR